MIEDDEAVVEADGAIRQFEIVDGAARELWFDKILQVVAPVAEAAAERERQIRFVEHLVTLHQTIKHVPRIAKRLMHSARIGEFASRTEGTKRQERPRHHEGVPGLRRIKS